MIKPINNPTNYRFYLTILSFTTTMNLLMFPNQFHNTHLNTTNYPTSLQCTTYPTSLLCTLPIKPPHYNVPVNPSHHSVPVNPPHCYGHYHLYHLNLIAVIDKLVYKCPTPPKCKQSVVFGFIRETSIYFMIMFIFTRQIP